MIRLYLALGLAALLGLYSWWLVGVGMDRGLLKCQTQIDQAVAAEKARQQAAADALATDRVHQEALHADQLRKLRAVSAADRCYHTAPPAANVERLRDAHRRYADGGGG